MSFPSRCDVCRSYRVRPWLRRVSAVRSLHLHRSETTVTQPGPYRKPDFRCEECTIHGERCILPLGHRGMHMLSGGDCWVTAGTAAESYEDCIWAGSKPEDA